MDAVSPEPAVPADGFIYLILLQAGPYQLSAGIAGVAESVISTSGTCAPGPPAPGRCAIDAAGLRGWTAGRPGRLHVQLADRRVAVYIVHGS